jgi:hypothetical protein
MAAYNIPLNKFINHCKTPNPGGRVGTGGRPDVGQPRRRREPIRSHPRLAERERGDAPVPIGRTGGMRAGAAALRGGSEPGPPGELGGADRRAQAIGARGATGARRATGERGATARAARVGKRGATGERGPPATGRGRRARHGRWRARLAVRRVTSIPGGRCLGLARGRAVWKWATAAAFSTSDMRRTRLFGPRSMLCAHDHTLPPRRRR